MEDFVPFELAVKLKEKGFDWETSNVYERNTIACRYEDYPKPTISQVLKWLREEKKIHIVIDFTNDMNWFFLIAKYYTKDYARIQDDFNSYEETSLAGIEYVLDNLI